MNTDDTVFRSVYVDPEVDRAVFARAESRGQKKTAVYLEFLAVGLAQFTAGAPLPRARRVVPILRAVGLDMEVDEQLRVLAFDLGIEKTELGQRLTQLGMRAIDRSGR